MVAVIAGVMLIADAAIRTIVVALVGALAVQCVTMWLRSTPSAGDSELCGRLGDEVDQAAW